MQVASLPTLADPRSVKMKVGASEHGLVPMFGVDGAEELSMLASGAEQASSLSSSVPKGMGLCASVPQVSRSMVPCSRGLEIKGQFCAPVPPSSRCTYSLISRTQPHHRRWLHYASPPRRKQEVCLQLPSRLASRTWPLHLLRVVVGLKIILCVGGWCPSAGMTPVREAASQVVG